MLFSFEEPENSLAVDIAQLGRWMLAVLGGVFITFAFVFLFPVCIWLYFSIVVEGVQYTPQAIPLNWGVAFMLIAIACLLLREALRILFVQEVLHKEEQQWNAIVSKLYAEVKLSSGITIPNDNDGRIASLTRPSR